MKFKVFAYADVDVNTDPEPWLEDILELETYAVEFEAADEEEAEELAWELLEPVMHRIESEEDIYSADWQLWWE